MEEDIKIIKNLFVAVVFDEKHYVPTNIYFVNPTGDSFFVSQVQGSYEEDLDLGWGRQEPFEINPNSYRLVDKVEDGGALDFTTWYYFIITTKGGDAYRVDISWSGRILWNRERYERESLPVLNKKGFHLGEWSFIEKFKENSNLIIPPIYYCPEDYSEKYMNENAIKNPADCLKTLKQFGGITEEEYVHGLKLIAEDTDPEELKNRFPKSYQRLLRLRVLKKKILDKLKIIREKNKSDLKEIDDQVSLDVIYDKKNHTPLKIYLTNNTTQNLFVVQDGGFFCGDMHSEDGDSPIRSFKLNPTQCYEIDKIDNFAELDFTNWYHFYITDEKKNLYKVQSAFSGRNFGREEEIKKNELILREKDGRIVEKEACFTLNWDFIEKIKNNGRLLLPPIFYCCEDEGWERVHLKRFMENFEKEMTKMRRFGFITEEEFENVFKKMAEQRV